jgi:hypothetical protein
MFSLPAMVVGSWWRKDGEKGKGELIEDDLYMCSTVCHTIECWVPLCGMSASQGICHLSLKDRKLPTRENLEHHHLEHGSSIVSSRVYYIYPLLSNSVAPFITLRNGTWQLGSVFVHKNLGWKEKVCIGVVCSPFVAGTMAVLATFTNIRKRRGVACYYSFGFT